MIAKVHRQKIQTTEKWKYYKFMCSKQHGINMRMNKTSNVLGIVKFQIQVHLKMIKFIGFFKSIVIIIMLLASHYTIKFNEIFIILESCNDYQQLFYSF